jgi:4-amino-4-deoxy-L-arabinose transferase-like glycosyltransferase
VQQRLQSIAIAAALTLIAAVPRFHDLGFLSFYGDEQLTAMVSRSIAEGHGAKMPSGMPYLRGLPFSYLAAASSEVLGAEHEFSYRFPAAVFGTLTVPLLFLVARRFVGRSAALLAALLLALADWHVVTSREARMYSPYLFFFIATTFTAWYWVKKPEGHRLLLPLVAILFAATASCHELGILAVVMLPIPLAFIGWTRIRVWIVLAFTTGCLIAAQYYSRIVLGNFHRWAVANGVGPAPRNEGVAPFAIANLPTPSLIGAAVGAGLGLWAARAADYEDQAPGAALRRLAHYGLGGLMGALAGAGMLHGAALVGLLFLVMYPPGGLSALRRAYRPLAGIAMLALIQLAAALAWLGPVRGLKQVVAFPFPYVAQLATLFPGVTLLFIGTSIWLALRAHREQEQPLRGCLLAALVPLAAIGVARPWGDIRYLMQVFPFILLLAATGLVGLLTWAGHWSGRWGPRGALAITIVIALSGVLGGHGLPQVWQKATAVHGTPQIYRNPGYYPDHKAPGEFVRQHRKPGDLVVTENALRQRWYTGPIDYWLRKPGGSIEVFRAPDGTARDAYLNLIAPEREALEQLEASPARIWIVTSAEHWEDYFSPDQKSWLEAVQRNHEPVFVGRDGVTKVYCVNCEKLE